GQMFGLDAPDPTRARVLELGCASGGNLVPMAFRLPEGRFLGVELAARQVQDGQRLLAELGLDNIRIEQGDIMELGEGIGEFDYIITHGVYSWVPPAVQARILELCARHLVPHGIAYISYNTWPGWRMRGVVRDLLLYHTRGIEDPRQKLDKAIAFLAGFEPVVTQVETEAARFLREDLQRLRTSHPSYLYHEYLETWNQPQFVSEFIATVEGQGLQYMCDADLKSMFPSVLGEQAESWLEQFETLAEQEQYLDYLGNRCFRQSLLCRAGAPLSHDLDIGRLRHMAFFANLGIPAKVNLRKARPEDFTFGGDKDVQVTHPLAKAALMELTTCYPDAMPFAELVESAAARLRAAGNDTAAEDVNGLLSELFILFTHQAVGMTPLQRRHSRGDAERPRAHRLARAQAAQQLGHLATARHSTILLDPFSTRLVLYLDGRRTVPELIEQLTTDIREQRLVLPDLKPTTPDKLKAQVGANVERFLKLFARQGILE
ncbi:MAG: methyltransferase regulatory domain-containing protein, partial [Gammaproteobacteria bacterium]